MDSRSPYLPFTDATAPPVVARVVIWTMWGLLVAGLLFLVFGRTDVVIRGEATLVPSNEAARIRAAHTGVVKRVLVREGQRVAQGEVLIQLDGGEHETRLGLLETQLAASADRLRDLESLVETRAALFDSEQQLRGLDGRVAVAQLDAAREIESAAKIEAELLELGQQRSVDLVDQGAASARDLEDAERQVKTAEVDLAKARADVRTIRAELSRISIEQQRTDQGAVVAALEDRVSLAEARERDAVLRGLHAEVSLLVERSRMLSPVDGIVQGLTLHTAGEVVEAGQIVAWVVPDDGGLVCQILVPSEGIGFVREGQRAHIKLDAYPYQSYGMAEATVTWVSPDAVRQDMTGARSRVYDARLELMDGPTDAAGERLPLRAGMTGVGELVVRRDRILWALLRPASAG